MLIDGFKFDLRLYVFVLSVDPLKIYLYDDGLARLCTTEYQAPTAKNLHKSKMHLTNYSLNKKSKHFVKGTEGSKRSLGAAFDYLAERGRGSQFIASLAAACSPLLACS
jgi:tubulin polyglutamylase TTLL6/13